MEKRERFKRLAPKRTDAVLEKLRILGHCASKSVYEYTAEDVDKIFSEVERCVEETKAKFLFQARKKFTL